MNKTLLILIICTLVSITTHAFEKDKNLEKPNPAHTVITILSQDPKPLIHPQLKKHLKELSENLPTSDEKEKILLLARKIKSIDKLKDFQMYAQIHHQLGKPSITSGQQSSSLKSDNKTSTYQYMRLLFNKWLDSDKKDLSLEDISKIPAQKLTNFIDDIVYNYSSFVDQEFLIKLSKVLWKEKILPSQDRNILLLYVSLLNSNLNFKQTISSASVYIKTIKPGSYDEVVREIIYKLAAASRELGDVKNTKYYLSMIKPNLPHDPQKHDFEMIHADVFFDQLPEVMNKIDKARKHFSGNDSQYMNLLEADYYLGNRKFSECVNLVKNLKNSDDKILAFWSGIKLMQCSKNLPVQDQLQQISDIKIILDKLDNPTREYHFWYHIVAAMVLARNDKPLAIESLKLAETSVGEGNNFKLLIDIVKNKIEKTPNKSLLDEFTKIFGANNILTKEASEISKNESLK